MQTRGPSPRYVRAHYTPARLPEYRGNPLIEALPPVLPFEEALDALSSPRVPYSLHDREADTQLRLQMVRRIRKVFTVLPIHYDLYQRITAMIEEGYESRNPLLPGVRGSVHKRIRELEMAARQGTIVSAPRSTAHGFTIVGVTGMGKSTAVERILGLFPQLIRHPKRQVNDQITYLHLQCPSNRSLKGLCNSFIMAVDELLGACEVHYYEKYRCKHASTESLTTAMAAIASNHHLGLLVLDEIQNLRSKHGADTTILNFLVELTNKLSVPILMIGTPDALDVLSQFRLIRRGTGQGDLTWNRMSPESAEWDIVAKSLWRYQYTRHYANLTDDIKTALYDESQGITDLAVKAFSLAQVRAIINGSEIVTVELLRETAREVFSTCQYALNALRHGDHGALQLLSDLSLRYVFSNKLVDDHVDAALAALDRQESLQRIMAYNEKVSSEANLVDQVAAWLAEGGVELSVAAESARKATEHLGVDAEAAELRRYAWELCRSDGPTGGVRDRGARRRNARKKRTSAEIRESGEVAVAKRGVQEGLTEYEALKESGLISPAERLLGSSGPS